MGCFLFQIINFLRLQLWSPGWKPECNGNSLFIPLFRAVGDCLSNFQAELMWLHFTSFSCFNPWNKFNFMRTLEVIGPVTASADNEATVFGSCRPFDVVEFDVTETQPRHLSVAVPSDLHIKVMSPDVIKVWRQSQRKDKPSMFSICCV